QSLFELCRGFPAHCLDAAAVEQFARRSVWPRPIIHHAPFETHAAFDLFGELRNCDVTARADIDMRVAGIVPYEMNTGVCEIVHVKKLPPGRTTSPDDDLAGACNFGLVKTAQ